jgi:acyl-CoA thioesterase
MFITMQAICAEGKVRGGASVVAQAPAAKRALERFVHEMHSLFLRAGEPREAITVGFLKHRDIEGNAMPSQVSEVPCAKGLAVTAAVEEAEQVLPKEG